MYSKPHVCSGSKNTRVDSSFRSSVMMIHEDYSTYSRETVEDR